MKPIFLEIPERFDTERLIVSNYEQGDGEEFYQLLQSNYHHLQEEVSDSYTLKSIEVAEEYVRFKRIAWLLEKGLFPKLLKKLREE